MIGIYQGLEEKIVREETERNEKVEEQYDIPIL